LGSNSLLSKTAPKIAVVDFQFSLVEGLTASEKPEVLRSAPRPPFFLEYGGVTLTAGIQRLWTRTGVEVLRYDSSNFTLSVFWEE
jgi:hypothetical protein